MTALIIGAGIFGVTAALELRARGHRVVLLDPGPLPHPLAASTDISKVVRLEYGDDEEYVRLGERSLVGWRRWNEELPEVLFHETGVLFLRRTPMVAGTFEGDSLRLLQSRGHDIVRVTADEVRARFPAWNAARYPEGTFSTAGGFVESGRVVACLVAVARARGVELYDESVLRLVEDGGRVRGVETASGRRFDADVVVAATGAWTPHLFPFAADWLRAQGMPVFHLRPAEPALFEAARFPVFGADISGTGYYGFPLHCGVVKIANHGPGRALHPESPARVVSDGEEAALRSFLADTFPRLADAEIVHRRVCLYCDTWDGHFWIAPDPDRAGLVLATGGSGHAFKFAPVLGELIANAVEGRDDDALRRFAWRPDARPSRAGQSEERARRGPIE